MEFMYFVAILLIQMTAPISAQFMVHGTVEPLVAMLGGQVEIHCHISPPQSAAHMEIRWFRNRYTQPVYLYQDGRDLYAEILNSYVERTKLLKESIGEGNVTLRIENVVASDSGEYRCLFKDGDFSEEAIVEIKIAAVSLEIQFNVNITKKEIMVQCNSGGWFPKPQIQWIDNSGQIIPPSSVSYSQDESKLFHISTTLIFMDNCKNDVTCNLQNPITGQKKWTNIKVADNMCEANFYLNLLFYIISVPLLVRCIYFLCYQPRNTGFLNRRHVPCIEFILVLLFCVIFIAIYAVLLYFIKEPIFKDNIITDKDKLIFHAVIMLFVSMISFVFYNLHRVYIDEDSRHGEAGPCALHLNKLYYWLQLPSHQDVRILRNFPGTRSSNQDYGGAAAHELVELTTTRSTDFEPTERRATL